MVVFLFEYNRPTINAASNDSNNNIDIGQKAIQQRFSYQWA